MTVGQQTYPLPDPFFTIATQNPIEQEGTYPLPEAQLDRFMFNIKVDYPSADEEERILASTTRGETAGGPQGAFGQGDPEPANVGEQGGGERVHHSIRVAAGSGRRGRRTLRRRKFVQELVDWGAGPRAGQFLIQGGKALAAMDARFSVAIEDVQKIAIPVLRHRISTNFQAQAEGMSNEDIIQRLIRETPPPVIPKYEK